MTQEFMQDAIVEDLKKLFQGYRLKNSAGVERSINVFPQDLPIRAGGDIEPEPVEEPDLEAEQLEDAEPEQTEPEDVPEPYILVRIVNGDLPEQGEDERQNILVILVICVCDPDPNRQGYRDALHIVNSVLHHYGTDGLVARRYEVQRPIKWAIQDEDNHPYYIAAMALNFKAPAIFKEVPET